MLRCWYIAWLCVAVSVLARGSHGFGFAISRAVARIPVSKLTRKTIWKRCPNTAVRMVFGASGDIVKTEGKLGSQILRPICSFSAVQGRRQYMEDAVFSANPLGNFPRASLFAVFDGHSGKRAALFAKDRLGKLVADELTSNVNPRDALRRAFLKYNPHSSILLCFFSNIPLTSLISARRQDRRGVPRPCRTVQPLRRLHGNRCAAHRSRSLRRKRRRQAITRSRGPKR